MHLIDLAHINRQKHFLTLRLPFCKIDVAVSPIRVGINSGRRVLFSVFDSVAVSCQMADVPERKRTGQWTADRVRLWDWTSVSVSLCLFLEFLRIRFLNLKFPFFVIGIWSSVQRRVLVLDSSASTLDFLAFSCAGDFFLCLPVCVCVSFQLEATSVRRPLRPCEMCRQRDQKKEAQ